MERHPKGQKVFILSCLLIVCQFLAAQPGSMDSSFYNNSISFNHDYTGMLASQPDGKILIVNSNQLLRYHDIGNPDSSFGINGSAFINAGDSNDISVGFLAAQKDPKQMISYEPITSVNRQVAPYIAEDLLKHQRYW